VQLCFGVGFAVGGVRNVCLSTFLFLDAVFWRFVSVRESVSVRGWFWFGSPFRFGALFRFGSEKCVCEQLRTDLFLVVVSWRLVWVREFVSVIWGLIVFRGEKCELIERKCL
jgi:hypothetical protein